MARDLRPYLTIGDCAEILGVPTGWFYGSQKDPSPATKAGLKVIRVGRYLRVHPSDLEEFLTNCEKESTNG